jgi:uncharacterized protein YeaO (DUF488 family)
MSSKVKRVYEKASPSDGTRILVDRLWPRGLGKRNAAVDKWLRDLAPSDELRKGYHSQQVGWTDFRKRYLRELARPAAARALEELYKLARQGKVTLLFGSKNEEHNNATVLKELLDGTRKPPTSTGPEAAVRTRRKRAQKT